MKKSSLIMKGKLILLFSLILSGVICSCSEKENPTPTPTSISVTAITLNPASVSLKVGESTTITATVSPSNATNKKVVWSSSNASVATVNEGKVSAKAAGTADIIAMSDDSGIKATCKITVTAGSTTPENPEALNISITNVTATHVDLEVRTTSTKTYSCGLAEKSVWDKYGADAIWEDLITYFDDAGILPSWILTGDVEFYDDELTANTEYIVYAAFCDNKGVRTSDYYTKTFSTPSGGDNPSTGNVLPCEITYYDPLIEESHQYVLDYDGNGVIKSWYHFETGDGYTDSWKYDFTINNGSTLVESFQRQGENTESYSKSVSGGYVTGYRYNYSNGTNSWNYEYSNGYLTKATEKDDNYLLWSVVCTWSNNCLTKINYYYYIDDPVNPYSYKLDLTYGSDSNPYFGRNFDPMSIFLIVYDGPGLIGHDSDAEHMVGLLGHNSKYLPKSAKYVGKDGTINYSFTYKFSNGYLSGVKITSDADSNVYDCTIKNKSF